jgi:flavin prenyltransferase
MNEALHTHPSSRPIVVGITGASGVIYGVRLLEALADLGVLTHVTMTEWAEKTLRVETTRTADEIRGLARWAHDNANMAAPIASGSHLTAGMAIVPCSMNTLSALAYGRSDNLVLRAADVTLKEGRPLVAVVRETPLTRTHLRNMLECVESGVTIMPPMPAFYTRPESLAEHVDHFVGRLIDQFGIPHQLGSRWRQPAASKCSTEPTRTPASVAETISAH